MEELDQKDDDLRRALELMDRHGALADSMARARDYGAAARAALEVFPDSPARRALLDAVVFCIERAY